MARDKGTFNFAANFEVLAKAPLDARMLVGSYADLVLPATWEDGDSNIWLFDGAIVAVGADPSSGVYFLKDAANYTNYDNWIPVGSDSGGDVSVGVINIGDGSAGVFAGYDSSGNILLRELKGTQAVTVTQDGSVISIGIDASFGGEVNYGENVGTGDASVYSGKVGDALQFRELQGTENILISVSEGAVLIDTSGNFTDIYNLIDTKLDASGGTITGDLTIDGSLNVGGTSLFDGDAYFAENVIIDGSLFVRSVESIDVSGAFIVLNTGEEGTPPPWMQSGVIVDRGTEDPYVFIYDESKESFVIGVATYDGSVFNDASVQSVATREDNPIDKALAVWNETLSRFDTSTTLLFNESGLYVDSSVKITSLAGSGIRFVTALTDGTLDVTTLPSYVKEASIGETLYWDASGFLQVDASDFSGTYNTSLDPNLEMPDPVGGYPSGTKVSDLSGDTLIKMWDDLLFPTAYPSFTLPNNTFADNVVSLQEVSINLSITFTAGFSRGTKNPQYTSDDAFRSGLPNTYTYTGTGIAGAVSSTSLSDSSILSYEVVIGTQTWTNTVSYDEGTQPYDNKGNPYDASLAAGTTGSKSTSFEGVYPLFGTTSVIGTFTQQSLVSMLSGQRIVFNMVAETGGNKQAFSIADAWTGAPTSRPITDIETYNTVSSAWESTGLATWTIASGINRTIQGETVSYKNYTYNGTDRSAIDIRIVF